MRCRCCNKTVYWSGMLFCRKCYDLANDQADSPRCRGCDEPVHGTAFCRKCWDGLCYAPSGEEINAELLELLQEARDGLILIQSKDGIVYDPTLTVRILAAITRAERK